MRRSMLWVVVLAAAFAGCGGSPRDEIVSALHGYWNALAARDGKRLCAALTGGQLAQARRNGGCTLRGPGHEPPKIAIRVASISDAKAHAVVHVEGDRAEVDLVHRDDRWLIQAITVPVHRVDVATNEMAPTIRSGDSVQIRPLIGGVHRGELIEYHVPESVTAETGSACEDASAGNPPMMCPLPAERFVDDIALGRVIALGGEKISMRADGRLTINGRTEATRSILPCHPADDCRFGRPITVPPGTVFVLSDNRGDASDSRFFGPIPLKQISGRIA